MVRDSRSARRFAPVLGVFQMTPYYWKTPREGAERLAALDGLRVRASFRVHVFRRR